MARQLRTRRISPLQAAELWCDLSTDQKGFEKRLVNRCIGYGLFATKAFSKGSFLLEYRGVLTSPEENDVNDMDYVYHFFHKGAAYRIDASQQDSCLARWINDDRRHPNCTMKKMVFETSKEPHLCLFALEDIDINTELRYDYGTRNLPWRQSSSAASAPPSSSAAPAPQSSSTAPAPHCEALLPAVGEWQVQPSRSRKNNTDESSDKYFTDDNGSDFVPSSEESEIVAESSDEKEQAHLLWFIGPRMMSARRIIFLVNIAMVIMLNQISGSTNVVKSQFRMDQMSHVPKKGKEPCIQTLHEGRRNNPKLLPLTEDVVTLSRFLKDEVRSREEVLRNSSEPREIQNAWIRLAEIVLTQVIVFNHKRPGEIAKMTLSDYGKCTNGEVGIIDGALTTWEKQLCRVLWRVEIVGKRSRTVAVLLTDLMKHALDTLISKRTEAGIDENNMYLFAARSREGHLRGPDTVREHAGMCGAKKPAYLRVTRLRKHIATVSQIMNLQENELDLLAGFLGHDLRTHRQFYRLPESTLQVAKISKVLLKMEKGDIRGLPGKSLEDIQLNPSEEYNTDEESDIESDLSDADQPEDPPVCPQSRQNGASNQQRSEGQKKRRAWTSREKAAVVQHLRGYLQSRRVPGKAAIMVLLKAEPTTFANRSWRNVKDFVRNHISKKDPFGFLNT
ncbi:uncharacterized protein LOC110990638 [Acanthaster planci]|uniref:Uncharacterized protein LOC110990638 n=1 Tax=Acanthaster planci TaxID=133434 RepID=A0A8B8A224_ACAPL|nr:uncharacterized protein LOC110990638 [Acanthaster planci]